MQRRELAAKFDPGAYPIYDVLDDLRKKGFNPRKITQITGSGYKNKTSASSCIKCSRRRNIL
jgi:hypothetical protein